MDSTGSFRLDESRWPLAIFAFQRLCLNVIFSLKPPQYPHLVVSHLESALLWAAERFEAANLRETAACVREHPALRRAASAG